MEATAELAGAQRVRRRKGERKKAVKKVILMALMVAGGLPVASLSVALAHPRAIAREVKQLARVVRAPAQTWTCEHNRYRSAVCP
jgi:hypothetical protein